MHATRLQYRSASCQRNIGALQAAMTVTSYSRLRFPQTGYGSKLIMAGPVPAITLGQRAVVSQRGVIALESDSSMLMSPGCLSTVAMMKPRNLTIVIIDYGMYQITGKQPTTTQSTADTVGTGHHARWPHPREWRTPK